MDGWQAGGLLNRTENFKQAKTSISTPQILLRFGGEGDRKGLFHMVKKNQNPTLGTVEGVKTSGNGNLSHNRPLSNVSPTTKADLDTNSTWHVY